MLSESALATKALKRPRAAEADVFDDLFASVHHDAASASVAAVKRAATSSARAPREGG